MNKDKIVLGVLEEVATNNKLSVKEVEKMQDCMYYFIREKISPIDFANMTLEEFRATEKNFNIPSLCKMYAGEKKFKRLNNL